MFRLCEDRCQGWLQDVYGWRTLIGARKRLEPQILLFWAQCVWHTSVKHARRKCVTRGVCTVYISPSATQRLSHIVEEKFPIKDKRTVFFEVFNCCGFLRVKRSCTTWQEKRGVKIYDECQSCHELEDWSCHRSEDHQPCHCCDCCCDCCGRCRCFRCWRRGMWLGKLSPFAATVPFVLRNSAHIWTQAVRDFVAVKFAVELVSELTWRNTNIYCNVCAPVKWKFSLGPIHDRNLPSNQSSPDCRETARPPSIYDGRNCIRFCVSFWVLDSFGNIFAEIRNFHIDVHVCYPFLIDHEDCTRKRFVPKFRELQQLVFDMRIFVRLWYWFSKVTENTSWGFLYFLQCSYCTLCESSQSASASICPCFQIVSFVLTPIDSYASSLSMHNSSTNFFLSWWFETKRVSLSFNCFRTWTSGTSDGDTSWTLWSILGISLTNFLDVLMLRNLAWARFEELIVIPTQLSCSRISSSIFVLISCDHFD